MHQSLPKMPLLLGSEWRRAARMAKKSRGKNICAAVLHVRLLCEWNKTPRTHQDPHDNHVISDYQVKHYVGTSYIHCAIWRKLGWTWKNTEILYKYVYILIYKVQMTRWCVLFIRGAPMLGQPHHLLLTWMRKFFHKRSRNFILPSVSAMWAV